MNGASSHKEKEEEEFCEDGANICGTLLTIAAIFMVVTTLPLSLFFIVKVVQVGKIPS